VNHKLLELVVSVARAFLPDFLGTYSSSARKILGGRWSPTANGSFLGKRVVLWQRYDSCPGMGNAALHLGGDSRTVKDDLPSSCCFDDTSFVVSSPENAIAYGSTKFCGCEVWP